MNALDDAAAQAATYIQWTFDQGAVIRDEDGNEPRSTSLRVKTLLSSMPFRPEVVALGVLRMIERGQIEAYRGRDGEGRLRCRVSPPVVPPAP